MKIVKLGIVFIFIAGITVALAGEAFGYPPFLIKARKFGAKDCTFCHIEPEGGPPFNERGQWLLNEKERRQAEVVDPVWLADYKPGEAKDNKSEAPAKSEEKSAKTDKIDPKIYDAYTGEYETSPGLLTITREGDKLYGKSQDGAKEELIPQSETEFLVEKPDIRIRFVKDDKGQVTHLLILDSHGQETEAKKIK